MVECAACHTAYTPGLLPARSWQRIMAGLDRHYGTDASLDDATVQQLSAWLQANAGTYKRVVEEPPEDRLTRSAWFERKHREVPSPVWKHASVKSAANCAACHPGADRGDFDDDSLRLPAGVSLGRRWFWKD
jgi:nitrate/TMAO reductase-like tetraheme cytochrome c subunit